MIGYIILAIVVIFLAVLLIRTAAFKPAPVPSEEFADVEFDKGKAADCLAQLVKCKTVSYVDHSLEDDAEFEKLIGLLPSLYPNVFKNCDFTRLEDRGILFRWPGKGSAKGEVPKACKADDGPAVLMAHYDVVPVEEKNWDKDPFCAEVADGVMWGRGTLDTKVTFNGALFAADTLIAKGFVPEKDIYMAFSGQEEINGKGAVHIVDWLMERGIEPAMVVDEGGAVVEGVFPGVSGSCALIGIAEKGLMNVDFRLDTNGGHASAPAPHTPVGRLSRACVDIENNPCKSHFTEPVLKMFDTLGRHSSFLYRMIFANLWCFRGVLDMICKKSNTAVGVHDRQRAHQSGRHFQDRSGALPQRNKGPGSKDRGRRGGRAQPHLPHGRGWLGTRLQGHPRNLEGDARVPVPYGAVLRQPPLRQAIGPCVPLLRNGSYVRGAPYDTRKQRTHTSGLHGPRRGVLYKADRAVLRNNVQQLFRKEFQTIIPSLPVLRFFGMKRTVPCPKHT